MAALGRLKTASLHDEKFTTRREGMDAVMSYTNQGQPHLPRLPLMRYGLTSFGAISFTVWPCIANSLTQ